MKLDGVIEAVESFIADAHSILERHGGPVEAAFEELGERMKPLAERDDLEMLRDASGLPGNRLHSEPEGLQNLEALAYPGILAERSEQAVGVRERSLEPAERPLGLQDLEAHQRRVGGEGDDIREEIARLLPPVEVAQHARLKHDRSGRSVDRWRAAARIARHSPCASRAE